MNILSALTHLLHSTPLPVDAASIERRRQCAEALEAACSARPEPAGDDGFAAFAAQCRRVRESRYIQAPADLFHVC